MSESVEPAAPVPSETCDLECPICLQPCVHPVELPCRHIFCFLCIKGVAMQGPAARCAICRSAIPHNVLTHPTLKDISQLYKHLKSSSGFEWFYEARGGGWWQYDERSMQELDRAFDAGQTTCQLLIAGHLYEIDFPQMIQYRTNNRNLFRRIKRDVGSAEKRGIAGIRLSQGRPPPDSADASTDTSATRRPRNVNLNLNGATGRAQSGQNSQNQNQCQSDLGAPQQRAVSSDSDESVGDEGVDSDDPDYLEEEDEDEMELGEEEELEESEPEEDEVRDGARAPTRRSERSNSSTTQSPPPVTTTTTPSRTSSSSSPSSGSAPATTPSRLSRRKSSGGGGKKKTLGESSSASTSPSPQLVVDGGIRTLSGVSGSTIRLSPAPNQSLNLEEVQVASTATSSITTTSGITCLLIGPGVRITVDSQLPQDGGGTEEEIL